MNKREMHKIVAELDLQNVVLTEPVFVRRKDVRAGIMGAVSAPISGYTLASASTPNSNSNSKSKSKSKSNYSREFSDSSAQVHTRRFARMAAWSSAAAVVLVVGAGMAWTMSDERLVIGADSPKLVFLPDGSSIQAQQGAVIAYNRVSWYWDRSVGLRGDAYFEVMRGSRFVVTTPVGDVSVLGTKFAISTGSSSSTAASSSSSSSSSGGLIVQCYEGSVGVTTLSSGSGGSSSSAANSVNGGGSGHTVITRGQGVACVDGRSEEFVNPTPYYVPMAVEVAERVLERVAAGEAVDLPALGASASSSDSQESILPGDSVAVVVPVVKPVVKPVMRAVRGVMGVGQVRSVSSRLDSGARVVRSVAVGAGNAQVDERQVEVVVKPVADIDGVAGGGLGSSLMYDFDDEDLMEVAWVIERAFGVTIESKSKLRGRTFTGCFVNDNLEQTLDIVMGSSGVRYRVRGNVVYLR